MVKVSEFGARLRRERNRRGENQAQAAARFNVGQSSYHRWESGEAIPAPERLGDIAEYLGVDVKELWHLIHDGPVPTSLEEVHDQLREMSLEMAQRKSADNDLRTLLAAQDEQIAELRRMIQVLTLAVTQVEEKVSKPVRS